MFRWTRWVLLMLVIAGVACAPRQPAQAEEPIRTFPETGYSLQGPFLRHWEQNGGLAIFGYPVSPELWEDGRVVQYFERNRFELHPDNQAPFNVLLGLLGEDRLRADGRNWRTLAMAPAQVDAGCLRFPETQHSLCGEFRTFWEQNGGLPVFGYPLTEPFEEVSETDGKVYLVQYFERNRFELHPENKAPYRVLLGLLGRWRVENLLAMRRQPSQFRASVSGPQAPVQPLVDLSLTVDVPGYNGPAELRLLDGAGRTEPSLPITVQNGRATVAWRSRGALGAHAAAVFIDNQLAGISNGVYVLEAETTVETGQKHFDTLPPRVREFLRHDVSEYEYKGYKVRGYRSPDSFLLWLRDHVYQGLGYRYFETDMTSLIDYFRREQKADGAFDDYFAMLNGQPIQGRTEVEADLEFLFVQGVHQAWQATGDDAWMRSNLPAMEKGIAYSTENPLRWNSDLGLIRRPYTIDTWDFEYGGPTTSPDGKQAPRHWIDEKTRFGVMHGDNTGMAYAMRLMSRLNAYLGMADASQRWQQRSDALMNNLNPVAWNGAFFTHNVLEQPFDIPDLDEARQLSLSNAYALNREVLSGEQARAIIGEYFRRRQANPDSLQSEWYSIDPPFAAGSFGTLAGWGNVPGEYVNGGKMPLVGGELARGAFSWGEEAYGFDILRRYEQVITNQNGTYLWYYPAGNPGISSEQTLATDGWGSAAMLAALIEGAAGITDNGALYRDVTIAPRWTAAPEVQKARVTARYAASLGYVSYVWNRLPNGVSVEYTGSGEKTLVRLLLPAEAPPQVTVLVNGVPSSGFVTTIGNSRYVQIQVLSNSGTVSVTW